MGRPEDGLVIVGSKPTMNYVLACLTLFHQGSSRVRVRARGKAISKAVDVVLLVLNRFAVDAELEKVELERERLMSKSGRPVEKSAIVITLAKRAR
ncbi:MAG: DNA-binding protein Alba [Candidatus Nezhaarchaeales archaeon]